MKYEKYYVCFTDENGDLEWVESKEGEWDARETNKGFAASLAGGGSMLIQDKRGEAIIIPAKQITRIVFLDEIITD